MKTSVPESFFFNKVAGLRPASLLKETLAQMFFYEFCEIFKNTFFTEHLRTTASEYGTYIINKAVPNIFDSVIRISYCKNRHY